MQTQRTISLESLSCRLTNSQIELGAFMNTILRLSTVKSRTGLSRATIYSRMNQGTFPRQISLGGRAVGWLENEIEAWLSNQIEQSRTAKK